MPFDQKAYMKEYRKRNRKKLNEQNRKYPRCNGDKEKAAKQARKYSLKRLYGITPEDYNKMFEEQEGCCAICGSHQSEQKRPLCVDHCHETKVVRGLLCDSCNMGLGKFFDSPLLLENAIKYLQ